MSELEQLFVEAQELFAERVDADLEHYAAKLAKRAYRESMRATFTDFLNERRAIAEGQPVEHAQATTAASAPE